MFKDKLLNLVRQLYPTGRAWKMPPGSFFESLHVAINESKEQFYNDAVSTLDSLLPDNNNFTADDATDWERRLGMITNTAVTLTDRKAAILRKMQYPGKNPAKSHYLYIEAQLQAAGFNVYVYENMFPLYPTGWETKNPYDLLPNISLITFAQLGSFQLGDVQLNEGIWNDRVINNIDQLKDFYFNLGANLRSTIFIGGAPIGTVANVPIARKDEFRQLILKLKNTHIAAFLFINYV